MPELPTIGTPDLQGIWKQAVGLWSSISDNQDSEPSKSVKHETSELPTNQPENNKNFIVAGHIPDMSGINMPDQQKTD